MRVIEADAKQMLQRRGIAVPPGARVYRAGESVDTPGTPVAVKAQVLAGNRAASGLVTLADATQAAEAVARVARAMAQGGAEPLVLMEAQVEIAAEYYAAGRVDDLRQCPVLMFCAEGGSGIEERGDAIAQFAQPPLAELHAHHLLAFLLKAGVPPQHVAVVSRFCTDLLRVLVQEDSLLLEINPLAITREGRAVALDAKLVLDDSAAPRHLEWPLLASHALQSLDATPLENIAARAGFTFVELPGEVAVFSAGAGLGMCLTDVLADAGMPAANFSDASGGGAASQWREMADIVFRRAHEPQVKAILFFFTLTATSIKVVLDPLFHLLDTAPSPKPLVVALMCAGAAEREMTFDQAREQLAQRGHACVTNMQDAIDALKAVTSVKEPHGL